MKKRKKSDAAGLDARCRRIVRDPACLKARFLLLFKIQVLSVPLKVCFST